MAYGNQIRKLRTQREMNQKQLASELNISISTLSNYEKEVHAPSIDMLIAIANYFEVSTDYILGRTTNPISPITREMVYCKGKTLSDIERSLLHIDQESRNTCLDIINALELRALQRTNSSR